MALGEAMAVHRLLTDSWQKSLPWNRRTLLAQPLAAKMWGAE